MIELLTKRFRFSRTGEWGQEFLICLKCDKEVKKDGALKHWHWAHQTHSNPKARHLAIHSSGGKIQQK